MVAAPVKVTGRKPPPPPLIRVQFVQSPEPVEHWAFVMLGATVHPAPATQLSVQQVGPQPVGQAAVPQFAALMQPASDLDAQSSNVTASANGRILYEFLIPGS